MAPGGSSTPGMLPCQVCLCHLLHLPEELAENRDWHQPRALLSPHRSVSGDSRGKAESSRGRGRPLIHFSGLRRNPKGPPPPLCHPHPPDLFRTLLTRHRRGSRPRLRAGLHSPGLKGDGKRSVTSVSISNAPSNSSPSFSGSVCFSLKKQLGHFKSQSGLYSSTNNCLVPTQSSADGPAPAALQAPASPHPLPAAPEPGLSRGGTQSPGHPPEHRRCLGLQRTPGGFLRGWAALENTRCSLSASGSGGGGRAPAPLPLRAARLSDLSQSQEGSSNSFKETVTVLLRSHPKSPGWRSTVQPGFPANIHFFLLIGSVCVLIPINL